MGTEEQGPKRAGVWNPVLSHGHDELCQELPCLALYICDNFLSGEAGEVTVTNGFSYRFQAD